MAAALINELVHVAFALFAFSAGNRVCVGGARCVTRTSMKLSLPAVRIEAGCVGLASSDDDEELTE